MAIYDGNEWEVRMSATSLAEIDHSTKIPYVKSWSYAKSKGITQVPKGMGYGRSKEVHETLTEFTGSLEKTYCDTNLIVQSPGTASSPFGEIACISDVAWYLEFKNKITGKKIQFSGVHGDYDHPHAEDDFGTETWDWSAESITFA